MPVGNIIKIVKELAVGQVLAINYRGSIPTCKSGETVYSYTLHRNCEPLDNFQLKILLNSEKYN